MISEAYAEIEDAVDAGLAEPVVPACGGLLSLMELMFFTPALNDDVVAGVREEEFVGESDLHWVNA